MRVVFCGIGAIGSHAVIACRNLHARLVLVDFDRVESKNCLSQGFVKTSIGKNKATALQLQLSSFWGVKAEAFGVRVSEDNIQALCGAADLLVDAFDNAKSRRLLSDFARKNEKLLVHAGVAGDGTFGLVRWDARFVPDEAPEGAATCENGEHLPLVVQTAATLARIIQTFVRTREQRDALVTLNA